MQELFLVPKQTKQQKAQGVCALLKEADHEQINIKTSLRQGKVLCKTEVAEDRVVLGKCNFRKGLGEGLLRKATFQQSPEGRRE